MLIKFSNRSLLVTIICCLLSCSDDRINHELKVINIRVKQSALVKLAQEREEALQFGMLISNPDDFVEAKLLINDTVYKAKIRLKGDWLDHLEEDKWSFRINLKGKTWNGLDEFSLHAPKIRSFLDEYVLHQFCLKEEILVPKYEFVYVTFNDHSWVLYALEEHFDEQMLVAQRDSKGLILKFSEDTLWNRRHELGIGNQNFTKGFLGANIEAFSKKKIDQNSVLQFQFKNAKKLME
ncbi:MAG: CotH kinase family protein, partial [Bacteroidia bacterium]|nr:CotH kinase family protein [Bacteroidia bacterium]